MRRCYAVLLTLALAVSARADTVRGTVYESGDDFVRLVTNDGQTAILCFFADARDKESIRDGEKVRLSGKLVVSRETAVLKFGAAFVVLKNCRREEERAGQKLDAQRQDPGSSAKGGESRKPEAKPEDREARIRQLEKRERELERRERELEHKIHEEKNAPKSPAEEKLLKEERRRERELEERERKLERREQDLREQKGTEPKTAESAREKEMKLRELEKHEKEIEQRERELERKERERREHGGAGGSGSGGTGTLKSGPVKAGSQPTGTQPTNTQSTGTRNVPLRQSTSAQPNPAVAQLLAAQKQILAQHHATFQAMVRQTPPAQPQPQKK